MPKYHWFDLRAALISAAVAAFLLIAVIPAHAGPWDRLAYVIGQAAVDASQAPATPRMAQLVWQQAAKGPWNQDGLACTYNANGAQFVVFKLTYCPLELPY